MIFWMRTFNTMLEKNGLRTYLNIVYVDDQNWAGKALKIGVRWDEAAREMRWERKWEEDDIEKREKNDKRTMRELRKMANSIEKDIKMKEDYPSKNEDCKLPMLDTKMWVEKLGDGGEQIRHVLYEKPMVSRLVTMEKSSLPTRVKMTVLSQEIIRWKRNTHLGESKKESDMRMSKFMMKLKSSGYTRSQRWEILKSGTRGFNKMVEDEKKGIRRINRPRWEGGRKRFANKVTTKKNWYRRKIKTETENRAPASNSRKKNRDRKLYTRTERRYRNRDSHI